MKLLININDISYKDFSGHDSARRVLDHIIDVSDTSKQIAQSAYNAVADAAKHKYCTARESLGSSWYDRSVEHIRIVRADEYDTAMENAYNIYLKELKHEDS